jgi:hypothetical protein
MLDHVVLSKEVWVPHLVFWSNPWFAISFHSHPTIREEGGFAASRQREGAVDLKI